MTPTTPPRGTLPAVILTVPLVAALENAWVAIRAQHPDTPSVVVTLGSGSMGERAGKLKYGHFAAARWQVGEEDQVAELFVGGEGLARGAADVLATLLHEAAHGIANTREIQDTSRQGRYHNRRFAALAGEVGLTVTEDPSIGWSPSTLAPGTADRYAAQLDELTAALTAFRHAEPRGGRGGNAKDTNLAPATCGCGRRIRVARSVLEQAPITCGACGEEFALPDEDDQD